MQQSNAKNAFLLAIHAIPSYAISGPKQVHWCPCRLSHTPTTIISVSNMVVASRAYRAQIPLASHAAKKHSNMTNAAHIPIAKYRGTPNTL